MSTVVLTSSSSIDAMGPRDLMFFERLTSANLPEEMYQTWCYVRSSFAFPSVSLQHNGLSDSGHRGQWRRGRHYQLVTWCVELFFSILYLRVRRSLHVLMHRQKRPRKSLRSADFSRCA